MKQTAVEWLIEQIKKDSDLRLRGFDLDGIGEQAKEMEEKKLLEMLHKFGFDYTYNYRGEKTIYEWITEWFEDYKRLNNLKTNKTKTTKELPNPADFMQLGEDAFNKNVHEKLRETLSATEKQMWISGYLLALTQQNKKF